MNYRGIDHHKQYSHVTLMDENGEMVQMDGSHHEYLEDR